MMPDETMNDSRLNGVLCDSVRGARNRSAFSCRRDGERGSHDTDRSRRSPRARRRRRSATSRFVGPGRTVLDHGRAPSPFCERRPHSPKPPGVGTVIGMMIGRGHRGRSGDRVQRDFRGHCSPLISRGDWIYFPNVETRDEVRRPVPITGRTATNRGSSRKKSSIQRVTRIV